MRKALVLGTTAATLIAGAMFVLFTSVATIQPSGSPDVEKSGCCSWHGGVCGCEGGRAVCCDGILSPSCGC